MPVSQDLQTVISRVGAAIVARKTYGRAELGRLQRELAGIRDEALDAEVAAPAKPRAAAG
jgi:hypothetical protein